MLINQRQAANLTADGSLLAVRNTNKNVILFVVIKPFIMKAFSEVPLHQRVPRIRSFRSQGWGHGHKDFPWLVLAGHGLAHPLNMDKSHQITWFIMVHIPVACHSVHCKLSIVLFSFLFPEEETCLEVLGIPMAQCISFIKEEISLLLGAQSLSRTGTRYHYLYIVDVQAHEWKSINMKLYDYAVIVLKRKAWNYLLFGSYQSTNQMLLIIIIPIVSIIISIFFK